MRLTQDVRRLEARRRGASTGGSPSPASSDAGAIEPVVPVTVAAARRDSASSASAADASLIDVNVKLGDPDAPAPGSIYDKLADLTTRIEALEP